VESPQEHPLARPSDQKSEGGRIERLPRGGAVH